MMSSLECYYCGWELENYREFQSGVCEYCDQAAICEYCDMVFNTYKNYAANKESLKWHENVHKPKVNPLNNVKLVFIYNL